MQSKPLDDAEFYYLDGVPYIKLNDLRYELATEPFDALLNFLKIPIKYMNRLALEDSEQASQNINFWLGKRCNELALAIRDEQVVHVVESAAPTVSLDVVVTALERYWGSKAFVTQEGELYVALFKTSIPPIELSNGETGFISTRLTYSECFVITPRIDAVFTIEGSFENYYLPTQSRKFRVLGLSETNIVNEIIEFADYVTEQMQKEFIPALEKMIDFNAQLNIYGFVDRLCSELRLSKKICRSLLAGIDETEVSLHKLVRLISNNLLPEVRSDQLDYFTARDIEIALSKAIMYGRFK